MRHDLFRLFSEQELDPVSVKIARTRQGFCLYRMGTFIVSRSIDRMRCIVMCIRERNCPFDGLQDYFEEVSIQLIVLWARSSLP